MWISCLNFRKMLLVMNICRLGNTGFIYLDLFVAAELKKTGVTDVVICGMMTHMCIDTTVRAAKDFGYNATLISDACATKDLKWNGENIPADVVQNVYMASLHGKFANVITGEEYFRMADGI